jgi:hypothetical protein
VADAPKIMQDEFSIARGGSALFRLIWTDPLSADDKADLLDWLKLVERRIQRKPEGDPAEQSTSGVALPLAAERSALAEAIAQFDADGRPQTFYGWEVARMLRSIAATHGVALGRPTAAAIERCRLLDELIASWRDGGNSTEKAERRIQARAAVEAAWSTDGMPASPASVPPEVQRSIAMGHCICAPRGLRADPNCPQHGAGVERCAHSWFLHSHGWEDGTKSLYGCTKCPALELRPTDGVPGTHETKGN